METKKKILVVVIAIIIIAGAIMVGVKGFNVSLYLRDHDTFEYIFDQEFQKKDVKEICKEVFGDKKFEVRTVEVFNDSVYILAESISEEEETELIEKLFALYSETDEDELDTSDENVVAGLLEEATTDEAVDTGTTIEYNTEDGADAPAEETEKTVDDLVEGTDYELYHDSKIQLRDLLKPYILPTIIAAVIIIICMMVRYKILKTGNVIVETLKVIVKSIVVALLVLSVIAICRIPVNAWVLPGVMFFVLIYIITAFELEIRKKEVTE